MTYADYLESIEQEEKGMKDYSTMKVSELRKIAQGMKIKDYASAKKAYLLEEIAKVETAKAEAEKVEKTEKKSKKKAAQKYNGKTLKEWSEELEIPVATLRARLMRGWSFEDVFRSDNHKKKGSKVYEFNGKSQNLNAWAKELGISVHTLNARINRLGWEPAKAFATKSGEKKPS